MIVDGVSIEDLVQTMNQRIRINESDYQAWQVENVREHIRPRDWIRGSDFYRYWQCARMLFFDVHDPLLGKPYLPRGAYLSIVRHKIVEDYLAKHGWECELPVRNWFNIQGRWIKGVGRIDGLSPSKIVLEIKMGKPSKGHLLQTGYYQLHVPQSPGAILLYSNGSEYHKNLRPLAKHHLLGVTGCILSPFTPPCHPNFPHCLRQCIYVNRCGHETAPIQTGTSGWSVWYSQIRNFLRDQ